MAKTDMRIIHWNDIPAALGLLSRLPIRVQTDLAMKRGAQAAWAYPIAGAIIALLTIITATIGLLLTIPVQIVAGLILATSVITTGAMHEDGLADSADGLWGGWTKEKRLEIMKDSRNGAYGVLALVLSLLIRWAAIAAILETGYWVAALLATALLSRASMVALMTGLPHARIDGLSQSVGKPSPRTAWLAIGIATLGSVVALGLDTGTLLIVAGITTSLWAGIAHRKVGGQTGDILGATQQLTEIALLITLATIL